MVVAHFTNGLVGNAGVARADHNGFRACWLVVATTGLLTRAPFFAFCPLEPTAPTAFFTASTAHKHPVTTVGNFSWIKPLCQQ